MAVDDHGHVERQAFKVTAREQITPLILTFNEAPNITRTLNKLKWAEEIVVLDSFSNDETLAMVKRFSNARIVQRQFDSFAAQCNFGLQQIGTEWVLSLDADYVLSDELNRELSELKLSSDAAGYQAKFIYCIQSRALRASLYPPRTVLYRKARAQYHNEGHGHRVQIEGNVLSLNSPIFHDDHKPLDRWIHEQNCYALLEARFLSETPAAQLNRADRLRRYIVIAPLIVFFYTLAGKGLIFDGWPGWYYVFQRTLAEMMLSLRLMEQKWKSP
jgi:glycosyltransferase involved in cell wall biosynthesis